jgi:hypothetical protein
MTQLNHATEPFEFRSRLNLTLLTGQRARDLAELVEHLRTAPGAVIYYHTHHFLVQHQFLSPEPPNDFAYWVSNILIEKQLGEELAAVDILRFRSIRELRERLAEIIQAHLERVADVRVAPPGMEFQFMRSVSFVMPTGEVAHDLREFRDALAHVSLSSISYHMFDARLHLEEGDNDFSKWFEKSLDDTTGRCGALDRPLYLYGGGLAATDSQPDRKTVRLISGAKLFVGNFTMAAVLLAAVCARGGRQ